ncbi:T-lymphocyte activation antigen CD80-like [Strongylocentrotus purpuratus]|uniref:Ig-like domain-containing protein n=1 Tax=Strongylocentrotus purpuratus TaxID=7668 RepID=A0A7M7HDB2_STRPU|nr:T-lymphocyte activation antigen CD80-like [Strongylocentrotus purpuratus]
MADFQAILVITLLTWAAVGVFGNTPELSTTTGDTVNIPCVFEEGTLRNIYWYYDDGTGPQKILFLSKGKKELGAEYANRASLQNDNSTLILKDIAVADEGTYRCDVDRQGQTPVPNIKTKLKVFSLRPDTLPVISPCTWAVDSSSCSIHTNQSFTLTCTLPNVYPVQETELIWYRDGKRVSYTDDVTQNDDGTTDISRQIQVFETGNFTCNATYFSEFGGENEAVSVVAWIKPPADPFTTSVPNTPGKKMTSGKIAGMIIGIVLFVGISLVIIIFVIVRSKAQAIATESCRINGMRA